jgi:hypothetical protein
MDSQVFLNIEDKVDSAAKLAQTIGKPHNQFLFASEFNSMKRYVNLLRYMIILNRHNIYDILGNNTKVELGIITGSFITALNFLNPSNYLSPVLITYTIDGVDYVQAFVGDNRTYGIGEAQFIESDFLLLYKSDNQPILAKRIFKAYVTQIGTNAPEIGLILENEMNIIPICGFSSTGNFFIEFPDLYQSGTNEGKLIGKFYPSYGNNQYGSYCWGISANFPNSSMLNITTTRLLTIGPYIAGSLTNGVLNGVIEIEAYI